MSAVKQSASINRLPLGRGRCDDENINKRNYEEHKQWHNLMFPLFSIHLRVDPLELSACVCVSNLDITKQR